MAPQPRKRFAQHWLQSEAVLNKIIKAANLQKSDRVLEIGPGTGILTRRLLAVAQAVLAVEVDRDLCRKLVKSLGNRENFLLLEGDILSLDIETPLANFPTFQKPNKVVANIPYNITGPILEKLLGKIAQPVTPAYDSIVLLVQKEVAQRICADADSKNFGALSVRVQYVAEPELICNVPAKAFYPPPKVDSAVIRLHPRKFPLTANNPKQLEKLVKVGFGNKRKMLRNNLKGLTDSEILSQLLEQLEINPQIRAENLSVRDWVNLSNKLKI